MALKKPKRPKLRKFPKQPKAGSSLQSWENYKRRCDVVAKDNCDRVSEYNKKLSAYETVGKKKEKIKKDIVKQKEKCKI